MRTRYQKGYVFKKQGWWYVRYVDWVERDGSPKRGQIAKRVVEVSDRYRTEASVRPLVDEVLQRVNAAQSSPEGALSIGRFVDRYYLPWAESEMKASTFTGYRNVWKRYLKPRCSAMRVRDFRTCDGQRILGEVARLSNLSRYTLRNIKGLMSGIFSHAKRVGALDGVNPMNGVATPKAKAPNETYAYSLEEIQQMLSLVPLSAVPVIAAAAYGGFSRSELRGMRWEDYVAGEIFVRRGVWQSVVDEPKTRQRKAAVPVIEPLRKFLEQHRGRSGWPQSGYIFAASNGSPLHLDNLARRAIRPALKESGLVWHGWHSFRRGLATNLNRLRVNGVRVDSKVIQRILRHSNVSTTLDIYVKSVNEDAVAAMKALEEAVTCTNLHQEPNHAPKSGVVN